MLDLSPVGIATNDARLAPADETFGHYHLSIMGIFNEIAVAGSRFGDASDRSEFESGAFVYAIDAVRDWERRFPNDPGIPHALLNVVLVYRRLHNDVARDFAQRAVAWLRHDYPDSKFTAMALAGNDAMR